MGRVALQILFALHGHGAVTRLVAWMSESQERQRECAMQGDSLLVSSVVLWGRFSGQ